jgi:predicted Rossmann fold flavoprotein
MPDNARIASAVSLSSDYDVAIVGAGAAGLAAAIFARELNPRQSIALFDGAKTLGAKILVSGGGRCNVTNAVVTERDFWGGRSAIVRRVLRAFPVSDTQKFFARIGVALHEEADGKLFPDSNRARDVLRSLLGEIDRLGVHIEADRRVTDVAREGPAFTLSTPRGPVRATRVVLATGGRSLPKSGSDGGGYLIAQALGHTIVETTPALAPLVLADSEPLHARLSGVAHEAALTVWVDDRVSIRLTGSLLWTHFGISGPVALNASRHWARACLEHTQVRVTLNMAPPSTFESLDERLIALAVSRPRATVPTLLSSFLPASVGDALAAVVDIGSDSPAGVLSRVDRRRLAHALVEWPLPITDTRGYTYAEATAGGVPLPEIDPGTLESRVCPGLYLVGEMLDVDGRLGGFNFQWAWSSARVCARAVSGADSR